jgi:hypothetical protein
VTSSGIEPRSSDLWHSLRTNCAIASLACSLELLDVRKFIILVSTVQLICKIRYSSENSLLIHRIIQRCSPCIFNIVVLHLLLQSFPMPRKTAYASYSPGGFVVILTFYSKLFLDSLPDFGRKKDISCSVMAMRDALRFSVYGGA